MGKEFIPYLLETKMSLCFRYFFRSSGLTMGDRREAGGSVAWTQRPGAPGAGGPDRRVCLLTSVPQTDPFPPLDVGSPTMPRESCANGCLWTPALCKGNASVALTFLLGVAPESLIPGDPRVEEAQWVLRYVLLRQHLVLADDLGQRQ